MVGFEKALGAVKMIKDQIQYRSQRLLNLARGYFNIKNRFLRNGGQSLRFLNRFGKFTQSSNRTSEMSADSWQTNIL